MKTILVILLTVCSCQCLWAQTNRTHVGEMIDTSQLQLTDLTTKITQHVNSPYEKAAALLHWVSNRLEWKATDYQSRSVNQILARGGGNCFELAKVYMAMIKSIKLPYRPITEINLHVINDRRQQTAEGKVAEAGNRMSVFGRQHNDHRWLEVFDEKNNRWEPVDPSMNVIGMDQWLKARAWFGKRVTIDTAITNDMIIPFAIFVVGENAQLIEDRTAYYVSNGLNELYNGSLSKLKSWKAWNEQIATLSPHAKAAFEGKENLLLHSDKISAAVHTYYSLKKEYLLQQ